MTTFIVERYLPGISLAEAEAMLAREAAAARAMRAEGRAISVLRSTLVEQDEAILSVIEAESELDVTELGERTGKPADRIVPARELATAATGASDQRSEERR